MKQKLALACSLMHEPTILILDEPTTGVDPVTRREFWKLLGELVAEGLTLLVATPYLDEAERCSRVVLMHHGRVLADAAPGTIRSLLPGHIVELAAEPRDLAMIALRRTRGILDVQPFAALLHVHVEPGLPAEHVIRTSLAAAGADIQRLRTVPATLEDTFLHLTRSASTEEAA
jgi:ABC-2 type transport system ATP-binding protein